MRKFRALFVFLALAVVFHPALRAQQPELEGFDDFVESVMKEWKVPGLAIAVIKDGKVVLAKGYGHRNAEEQLPVTKDTLFAIGSNTKSFTATILGMLNDEGKLEWDTPVRDYLPGFRLYDKVATGQMTPRDLVSHRSGLPRHDLLWYATGLTRQQLFDRLRYLEPNKEFRSTWQYQNLMFMTAGYLEEKLVGKKWEAIVRARILGPLGMTRSNFSVNDSQKDANFAYPYGEIDKQVTRIPFRNIAEIGPAGSINSSVSEMIRYVRFHIGQGKHGEKQLLSKKNSAQMQSAQMAMPSRGPQFPELTHMSYGLGLMVANYRGHKLVQHGGGIDGFISQMAWLPDDKTGVVVLTNFSGNNPVPNLVVRNLFDRMLGMEPVDWVARQHKQQEEAAKRREKARKERGAGRKKGTSPSHTLADLAGTYEHPAYGKASIEVSSDGLKCTVVGFEVPLEHYHYDIFAVPQDLPPPAGNMSGTKITFFYNKKGDIDRLAIPLERSVADIIFTRVKDKSDARADE